MAGHRLARRVENRELSDHRADVDSGSATGSIGSWIEPPMFSLTPALISSSTMLRASVRDSASRSSLVTTRVPPDRHAASASRRPGRPG